jgi:hypothetical protein
MNFRVMVAMLLTVLVGVVPLSIGLCGAQQGRQFVMVESVHVDYDKVPDTEYVESGSKITIEVVLSNFSTGVAGNKSELRFNSDLGVFPSIIVDGTPQAYKIPFVVDHSKVHKVRVTLIGDAPEVTKRTDDVLLLNITQKVAEEYTVVEITRTVSSEAIEDAIVKIYTANETIAKANVAIADAEERGLNVEEANTSLKLADKHLKDANQFYGEGKPEEALEEAEAAVTFAQDAAAKAGSAIGSRTYRNYGIIIVVIVVVVVVVVLFLQQMKRKRGVY